MKVNNILFGSLACLGLAGFSSPVLASPISATSPTPNRQNYYKPYSTGPVNLVNLAEQGLLTNQGIPGHLSFRLALQSGKINAKSLVQAGIDSGRLSPNTINDSTYLAQVRGALSHIYVN